jgi:hypothetical protein
MSESRTEILERITCEEEERVKRGYDIKTFFSIKGNKEQIRSLRIEKDHEGLLDVKYIPAATLVRVNEKWKVKSKRGFRIDLKTGYWKPDNDDAKIPDDADEFRNVMLYTTSIADALYIQPIAALRLTLSGGIQ